jgi:hypothetical protein
MQTIAFRRQIPSRKHRMAKSGASSTAAVICAGRSDCQIALLNGQTRPDLKVVQDFSYSAGASNVYGSRSYLREPHILLRI